MKVIDISAWQTEIDWQALVDAGIEGVILKIGERSSLDNMFVEHINHAVEYGLQYGVYYFAHACTYDEAVAEADQVVACLTPEIKAAGVELLRNEAIPKLVELKETFTTKLTEQAEAEQGWCKFRDAYFYPLLMRGVLYFAEKALDKMQAAATAEVTEGSDAQAQQPGQE